MNESIKEKEFISTRRASELLGVAVSTIQLWTDDGVLNAWVTNGGHRRIALDSVEALLSKRVSGKKLSKPEESNIPANKKTLTVLLVEDDEDQIDLYRQQFEARELNVNLLEAHNGYDGLIKIGQYKPAIIITDLMMPDIDGFQMLETLKHNEALKDCLIIVVTALSLDEVENRGGLPDGVLFFTKPVVFDHLENTVLKKMLNHF
ncbi:MAG: response regulator [gamma proteobacterium symbiont of Taylorina sp.]|nr:response regulator [gamma proteobacterium symbiont of Taylorina sp.]